MTPQIWIRVWYRVAGAHVHCRVFIARDASTTFALAGELVFAIEEWDTVRATWLASVDLIEEDPIVIRSNYP